MKTKKEVKLPIGAMVKLNAYKIIDDAIERAILCGIQRAHKHVEHPSEDDLAQEIHRYIMNELSEILKFDDEV